VLPLLNSSLITTATTIPCSLVYILKPWLCVILTHILQDDNTPKLVQHKPYQGDIIVNIMKSRYFNGSKLVGVVFAHKFTEIAKNKANQPEVSIPMVALTSTSVMCSDIQYWYISNLDCDHLCRCTRHSFGRPRALHLSSTSQGTSLAKSISSMCNFSRI